MVKSNTSATPARKSESITVRYVKRVFARDGFLIGKGEIIVDGDVVEVSVMGDAGPYDLQEGHDYLLGGRFKPDHPQYGKQFAFDNFTETVPHDKGGIVRYLEQIDGIGPTRAASLWNEFGSEAVAELRKRNPRAIEISRLKPTQLAEAIDKLNSMASYEGTMIELMDLLGGHHFPKSTARDAIETWGVKAPEFIRANPFRLLRFDNIGYAKADALYGTLGLPKDRLKRQAYATAYTISEDRDGSVWVSAGSAESGLKKKLAGAEPDFQRAVQLSIRGKLIDIYEDGDGQRWLADHERAKTEAYIAEKVAEAEMDGFDWSRYINPEDPAFEPLTDHQRDVLFNHCLKGAICILGGSPGTGKSFTAACVMKALRNSGVPVHICAYTGKAAVRCTQAMQSFGLNMRATTIHTMLKVGSTDGENFTFTYGPGNPLPYRVIVLDEGSLPNQHIFSKMLAARDRDTAILIVGDIHQLPPVGHGAPLRDLIDAELPYGELTEIHRNSGTIVRVCKAIKDQQPFTLDSQLEPDATPPKNLKLISCVKRLIPQETVDLCVKLRDRGLCDPVWDTMVITIVNEVSECSRKELNKLLQRALNPNGAFCEGTPFRVDDKVIQLKNTTYSAFEQYNSRSRSKFDDDFGDEENSVSEEAIAQYSKSGTLEYYVANGEFGRVLQVFPTKTIVEFLSPSRIVVVPKGKTEQGSGQTGCDMDLGYAITGHKAQGSECKVAIFVLDEYAGAVGPHGVADRSLAYTNISRGKYATIMVGQLATLRNMISRSHMRRRKTFLSERIRALRGERQMAESSI